MIQTDPYRSVGVKPSFFGPRTDVRLVKLQMLRLAEELDSAPGIQKFDSCSIAVVLGIAHSETESMPVHQVPI